ncbi:MAG: metallopeptidase family protein [Pseudomonadota bacterium]
MKHRPFPPAAGRRAGPHPVRHAGPRDAFAGPRGGGEWRGVAAPDAAAIAALAERARARLPDPFRAIAAGVVVVVEDLAADETLAEVGAEDPFALTGLYQGVALTEASHADPAPLPATIRLFRRAILDEWAERGDVALDDLVAHILVHEFAHHLGWSDADIAAIDRWWE